VLATAGLAALAFRQEQATYYSNLLTKQIEYSADLLAQLAVGNIAAVEVPTSNAATDAASTHARLERNKEDLARLIRAAELVRIVSPPRVQIIADHIIDLAQKILITWPTFLARFNSQEEDGHTKLRISEMKADYGQLAKIRHELQFCLSHVFLSHSAVTDAGILDAKCDLHIGERDPRQAKLQQSNTPECRQRQTCRLTRRADGSLPCDEGFAYSSCGYPE
jgi:hypothetical protein